MYTSSLLKKLSRMTKFMKHKFLDFLAFNKFLEQLLMVKFSKIIIHFICFAHSLFFKLVCSTWEGAAALVCSTRRGGRTCLFHYRRRGGPHLFVPREGGGEAAIVCIPFLKWLTIIYLRQSNLYQKKMQFCKWCTQP